MGVPLGLLIFKLGPENRLRPTNQRLPKHCTGPRSPNGIRRAISPARSPPPPKHTLWHFFNMGVRQSHGKTYNRTTVSPPQPPPPAVAPSPPRPLPSPIPQAVQTLMGEQGQIKLASYSCLSQTGVSSTLIWLCGVSCRVHCMYGSTTVVWT